MSPTPFRRAAAVVALSVLALGGGAAGAQAHHGKPKPTPSVTAEPTRSPTSAPTVTAEPTVTPTAEPTVTPAPSASPTSVPAPSPAPELAVVPAVEVLQPRCENGTVVPTGTIVVQPTGDVVAWAVVDVTSGDDDEEFVAEGYDGERGDVVLEPGRYEVWADTPLDGFGDLGPWVARYGWIALPVTIEAFTGECPAVTPSVPVVTPSAPAATPSAPAVTPSAPAAAPAWSPSADQLVAATEGGFTAAARVAAGGEMTLRGLPAGAAVRPYLFSVPTDLGASTVAADGTVTVTVPAGSAVGKHRIAVYLTDGTLVGWRTVEVLAAGTQLAATGADPRAGVAAGLVLVAAGGALVVARRRTAVTSV